jgi:hypothetical protein
VDTAESAQPTAGGSYIAQDRYLDSTVIAKKNELHLAGPMDDEAYLAVQLCGERSHGTGQVSPDNFIWTDFSLF